METRSFHIGDILSVTTGRLVAPRSPLTTGPHRDVPRLPARDHARIDPLLELQHIVGADRVIPVMLSAD